MKLSQSKLASRLNTLVQTNRVVVTETSDGISIYQLRGGEASELISLFETAGWTAIAVQDDGGEIQRHLLTTNGEGVQLTALRPQTPVGVEAVVTISGFEDLLDREPSTNVVWVEGLSSIIETRTVRYCPWWTDEPFEQVELANSVSKVVRVLGRNGPGANLGRWLLKSTGDQVGAIAALPWRQRSASRLMRAMAQEIETDDKLLFRGPPTARFLVCNLEDLPDDLFAATQSVAEWLLENERELENRHGLLAAEIARTSMRNGDARDLASTLAAALEGARIAYHFGVSQQSRDTLRSLSDLRKAVSDDAAKLSETTRSLGSAIAGAVFGNIGLIVARLTLPANAVYVGPAAKLLSIVLFLYVLAIIISGFQYLCLQRYLRREWRDRLYIFLPNKEYQRMVEYPIARAETAFYVAAGFGMLMLICLVAAALLIADSGQAPT